MQGAVPLALLMIGLVIWSGAYAFLWASTTIGAQFFWMCVMYVGVQIAPISFYVFVARVTQSDWLKYKHIAWLSVFPVLLVLMLWTNNLHHFFFTETISYVKNGFFETNWVRGGGWWLSLTQAYFFILGGIIILAREINRASILFRSQLITILAGALLPWGLNIFTQFWFVETSNLDLTPVVFSISCLFFAYAIFMQGLFNFLPVARNLLVEKLRDGIIVFDSQFRLIDINPAAEKALNVNAKHVLGKDGANVFPDWVDVAEQIKKTGREFHMNVKGLSDSDRRYDLNVSPFEIDKSFEKGYLVILRDITHHWDTRTGLQELNHDLASKLGEISELQVKLREQAIHDSLTGVYNRRFLDETLQTALKHAMEHDLHLSLVMMDIDNFKDVNDIYGHKAGDLILQQAVKQADSIIREGDLVCRYGGDEFVIILPNVSQKIAFQRAEQVRKKIEEMVVEYKMVKLRVTSSMGIATFPEHGSTPDILLRAVDKAMYASKMAGRNRATIFDIHGSMNTARLKMPPR